MNMEQPHKRVKVSVCVVTYNQERYIEQCLRSIAEQHTDFHFEVFVSDDCSTDATRAIVETIACEYPQRVRPILQPVNLGMLANYRAVHEAATAEFTCHCDGDDFWHPGKLQAQVDFLESQPDCVSVFTNANVIAEDGAHLGVFSSGVPATFDASFLIRRGNFLNHSSMMYRTALRKRMMPLTPEFIDFELYLALCRHGRLGFVDALLVSYRDQAFGSTIRTNNSKIRSLYWQALCTVDDQLATADAYREALSHFLASAAQRELLHGSFASYREWSDLVQSVSPDNFYIVRASAVRLALASILRGLIARTRSLLKLSKTGKRVFYPR